MYATNDHRGGVRVRVLQGQLARLLYIFSDMVGKVPSCLGANINFIKLQ